MRISGVRLRPYRLGLKQPWLSARGRLGVRSGWLVILEADRQRIGLGDCAPLPGAGTETAEQAFAALQEMTARLIGRPPGLMIDGLDERHPAARAAVECALLDLLAQVDAVPLARRLSSPVAESVRANAALGPLDATIHARAQAALVAGHRVLKIKMGVRPAAEELAALTSLASILPPEAGLRLDANGAWPEGEAWGMVEALGRLPIESLEDPLAEPSIAGLARLQAKAPFPLAADEALIRLGIEAVLAACPVRRLVLKPMVLGGALPAVAVARRAQAMGLDCVVTTTVDSAIGCWLAVHLAAAVDPERRLAHGLATSNWLARDVAEPPAVIDGVIPQPAIAGLGAVISDP